MASVTIKSLNKIFKKHEWGLKRHSLVMKTYLFSALLLALSLLLNSCEGKGQTRYSRQPHLGVWEDVGFEGRKATLVFKENGTGTLLFDFQLYDFRYIIDYSKKPVWLDLIYTREGMPYRAKVIVKFLDLNRLKWRTFFGSTRPTEFIPEDDKYTVLLKRYYPLI
ncbi:MAG: hypothetical protein ABII26_01120 [Pseudomonadota bacterium]